MNEPEWRPVIGASRYEVSSDGRVRSNTKEFISRTGHRRRGRGVELKPTLGTAGYNCVTITMDAGGPRRCVYVQVLMCEAFYGPRPTPLHQARHLNDIKTDNRLENLAWGTRSENTLDAVRNGVHPQARKTHCPHGHEYESVRIDRNGWRKRRCGECHRQQYWRKKGSAK